MYNQQDNIVYVTQQPNTEKLLGGMYYLEYSIMTGFYLKRAENFVTPELFGDVDKRASRILKSYHERSTNTGVILTGMKGAGKTLLMKYVSSLLSDSNIPTLIITESVVEQNFSKFISGLPQSFLVLFDEYDKMFNKDTQTQVLTLLDGIDQCKHKHMFIISANESRKIHNAMLGRPGRVLYLYEYSYLTKDVIDNYGKKHLNNPDWTSELFTISEKNGGINFDILQAIVSDSNMHNESPLICATHLNIQTDGLYKQSHEGNVYYKGEFIESCSDVIINEPIKMYLNQNPDGEGSDYDYIDFKLHATPQGLVAKSDIGYYMVITKREYVPSINNFNVGYNNTPSQN